jgi:HEPN domain-containing protein
MERLSAKCQQAVEKAIKAILVSRNLSVRRTHNIQELKDFLLAQGTDIRTD